VYRIVAPEVVVVIVTSRVEEYVPVPGLNWGAATVLGDGSWLSTPQPREKRSDANSQRAK
jgi:hypothetical protein